MMTFKNIYIIFKNIKINNNRDNNIKKYFHYIIMINNNNNNNNNMSKYPCVSVLTPTYNRKIFIELCMFNLNNQTKNLI